MHTTKEAITVLNKLAEHGIDYALIRNFDCIIKNKPFNEKDIDILILKKDRAKATILMQAHGFKKLWLCPSTGHIGFAKYIDGKFLSFHYHAGGVAGSNIPYLDAEQLLKRKQQNKQINIVSDEDRFLAVLLHSVLDGTKIKDRYKQELGALIRKNMDWDYIKNTMNSVLNPSIIKKILFYVQQNGYGRIENITPKIQNNFKYGKLSRILQLMKSGIILRAWGIWRLTKNAPLVSFIGMDGTGKTTMTSLLKKKLDHSLITNELIYTGRGRNNILPIQFFGTEYYKLTHNSPDKLKINSRNTASFAEKAMHIMAAPVFALDLFLRYWLVIWPKRKTKQIVLTDRYSTDILLMKDVPSLLKNVLFLLFPRPTLTIYLYNHPQILHKRKPDHPLNDLYRQQKIFAKINKRIMPIKIKSDIIEKTFNKIGEQLSTVLA